MNNNSATYSYRYKSVLRVVLIIALTAMILVMKPAAMAHAATAQHAFEIQKYQMLATVNKDHSFDIKKSVTVNLPDDRNDLKLVLCPANTIVSDISTNDLNYVTITENGTKYINITAPDQLKAGVHVITVNYVLHEMAEKNTLNDKMYLDALLPEWRQPIGEVEIELQVPEDFDCSAIEYYAGQFGIQDTGRKMEFSIYDKSGLVTLKGSRIPENYGISLMAELPDGYWVDALDGTQFLLEGFGIIGAILLICFVLWLIGGRDPKTGKIRQTHPVEGISPAELGYIFDGKVKKRDIIALVIYLGTKGYLRISEYKPKKFRLYRLEDPKGEEKYIRTAYYTLFEDVYEGRSIDLEDTGSRFKRIFKNIQIDIESGFNSNDMLPHTPLSKIFRVISWAIASISFGLIPLMAAAYQYIEPSIFEVVWSIILAGFTSYLCCFMYDRADTKDNKTQTAWAYGSAAAYAVIAGYELVKLALLSEAYILCIGMYVCYLLMLLFVLLMQARGKGNAELVAKYRSLRRFIYRAKAKDVAGFYKEDRNYYYSIVPYAYYFLGLETWAKAFKWLEVDDPVWYSDDIEGHAITHAEHKDNALDVARTIKTFARTLETGLESVSRYNLHR